MSLDQQIQACEDRISQLEQTKRMMVTNFNDLRIEQNQSKSESDLNRIDADLDESYQHYAILKIRRMMGF